MNAGSFFILSLVLLMCPACARNPTSVVNMGAPPKKRVEWKDLKSVRVGYTLARQRKYVLVDDPKKVKELLKELQVMRTRDDIATNLKPTGTVEFTFANNTSLRCMFIEPTRLQVYEQYEGVPLNFVIADKFYRKVCEVASEAEGRAIDVLKDNK